MHQEHLLAVVEAWWRRRRVRASGWQFELWRNFPLTAPGVSRLPRMTPLTPETTVMRPLLLAIAMKHVTISPFILGLYAASGDVR